MKKILLGVAFITLVTFDSPFSAGEDFSCYIGKRGACLDYGDTVCSSGAKCVNAQSDCFDEFQCNFEGFACKSSVTEIGKKYDELVGKFNNLVDKNSSMISAFELLQSKYSDALETEVTLRGCVNRASTFDEAKSCSH